MTFVFETDNRTERTVLMKTFFISIVGLISPSRDYRHDIIC